MYLYRYRSPGLISQKELIYDEFYFASTRELNDPLDMNQNYIFDEGKKEIWKEVFATMYANVGIAEHAADYFNSICPISYSDLMQNIDFHSHRCADKIMGHMDIQTKYSIEKKESITYISFKEFFKISTASFFEKYKPRGAYSVSLSNCNNSELMWSNYTQNHTGFSLILLPFNGHLSQPPLKKKTTLRVSDEVQVGIDDKFEVNDVIYSNKIIPLDAFTLLPVHMTKSAQKKSKQIEEQHAIYRSQLLTKNTAWRYEQESRLILDIKSNAYCNHEFTSYQRLFNYDFKHVAGVIFGSRMSESEKSSIREIIDDKLAKRFKHMSEANGERAISFLYQQAEINHNSRIVDIIDKEVVIHGNTLSPGDDGYDEALKEWKKFER